ncbi:hypothetical protein [Halpernia sp.]
MNSLIIQYIIIAIVFLFAAFYLIKIITENFSTKKQKKGEFGCDRECGH